MCVAAIAWNIHPELLLVAIGNRDEFHERPAAPLARWDDGSGIIAGRDLQAGGTWLGVSDAGRFALLTNFRDPAGFDKARPSRGSIVTDLLAGSAPRQMDEMNPFNVFHAGHGEARFLSNYPSVHSHNLRPGIHGLSNGPLGKPWPKTRMLCTQLEQWLGSGATDVSQLFANLRSETPRPDDTDLLDAPEPDYSPIFIRSTHYGTRCSTIVVVKRAGKGTIIERSFDSKGTENGEVQVDFVWPDRL